jgi:transposase InsO family protein
MEGVLKTGNSPQSANTPTLGLSTNQFSQNGERQRLENMRQTSRSAGFSEDFRAIRQSANRFHCLSLKGSCYDNAAMGSFWTGYKNKCVYADQEYSNHPDAIAATFACIEVSYNRIRLYSSLGYKFPFAFKIRNN